MAKDQAKKALATIGRTVRYVLGKDDVRAAIVAGVADAETGALNLSVIKNGPADLLGHSPVMTGGGMASAVSLVGGVDHDPTGETPHTWHWPKRDDEEAEPAKK